MIKRYRLYRSYGHSRFIAAGLAPSPEIILVATIVACGIMLGVSF
jgi:hypothetical protein